MIRQRQIGDGLAANSVETVPEPRRADTGSASLELLGMIPLLILVALAGVQLGIAAYCASQAGTAARAAARVQAQDDDDWGTQVDPLTAGKQSVSGWLRGHTNISVSGSAEVTATATVDIPSLFPGVKIFGPVTRSATMPGD